MIATFVAAVVVLSVLAGVAEASPWTVGTTSDAPTGNCPSPASICSLRQIVNAINASPFTPDTITVPAGNYTLSQGSIVILQSMSIAGAGARSTVVAEPVPADRSSGGDRVFDIQAGGGVTPTVSISSLEVTGGTANPSNGYFGGDIRNAGTLTLTDDWITNGSAYSGGGIGNSSGSLTIERTLISGNSAPFGGGDSGGVENFGCPPPTCATDQPGHLVVDDSTVTGNDARLVGGVFSWNDDNNTLTVSNSTIAGNETTDEPGGGARLPAGGGLGVGQGTERIQNTIIANNVDITGGVTSPANCGPATGGGITSLGHNLDSGTDCALPAPSDVSNTDPLLGPLQNNGGPTDTLALAPNSPAVDQLPAGGAGCPAIDQRGVPRPQGPACDIGSFELATPAHCNDVSAQTPAGGGVTSILFSCRGPEPPTSYAIVAPPSHGTLAAVNQTNGSVNYTPGPGFQGTDRFTYDAVNAGGTSNTATAMITSSGTAAVTLRLGSGLTIHHLSAVGAVATMNISCGQIAAQACDGILTAFPSRDSRARGRPPKRIHPVTVAHAAFHIRRGSTRRVTLALNHAGVRLIRARYRLPVTVALTGTAKRRFAITYAYPRVNSLITYAATYNTTCCVTDRVSDLAFIGIPRGAHLSMLCLRGGCSPRSRTFHATGRDLRVGKSVVVVSLPTRATVDFMVTVHGAVGIVDEVTNPGAGPATDMTRCLPPWLRHPVACPSDGTTG